MRDQSGDGGERRSVIDEAAARHRRTLERKRKQVGRLWGLWRECLARGDVRQAARHKGNLRDMVRDCQRYRAYLRGLARLAQERDARRAALLAGVTRHTQPTPSHALVWDGPTPVLAEPAADEPVAPN